MITHENFHRIDAIPSDNSWQDWIFDDTYVTINDNGIITGQVKNDHGSKLEYITREKSEDSSYKKTVSFVTEKDGHISDVYTSSKVYVGQQIIVHIVFAEGYEYGECLAENCTVETQSGLNNVLFVTIGSDNASISIKSQEVKRAEQTE